MPEIVLIRGVPGSGKTTIARTMFPDHILCEADQFFEGPDGYRYDRAKIKEAHEFCYNNAVKSLSMGLDVVVANTFTRIWEMKKYLSLGLPVVILEAKGNYKNVHGVPEEVVERMRERYEPLGYVVRDRK